MQTNAFVETIMGDMDEWLRLIAINLALVINMYFVVEIGEILYMQQEVRYIRLYCKFGCFRQHHIT